MYLLTLILCATACDKGPDYGDTLYMTGTLTSPNIRFLVDGHSSIGLTVTSTDRTDTEVRITLKAAPELLESFNASTGRNYQLPPEDSYIIDGNEVVIEAGKYQSTQIQLDAFSDNLQEGVAYCIPVSITSVEGGDLKVLEASRTAYVMLTKVITVQAASLNRNNCFDILSFGEENSPVTALGQMTLEMKVLPVSFPNTPSSANGISSLVGCEENFLFRFGDGAGNPTNKLQLSKGAIGTAFHPDQKDHYNSWTEKEFETGHWLHFAAVYDGHYLRVYLDGEEIHVVETKGGTINLGMSYDGHTWNDTFAIGRSVGYARMFDGYISECRVWNVARSTAELEDGICYVDPTNEGLVAYWRFDGETQDDGTVLDITGHGHNAKPYRTIQWVDNQKCPF